MTRTPRPDPLRDALYELATSKPAPDAALLDDLVRRHPEHATELTEVAVDLALDAAAARLAVAPEEPLAPDDPLVVEAMRRFRASLDAAEAEERAAPENPFEALDRAALRALAGRLHASTVFIIKLRDRLIAAETMTAGFVRRVAEELGAELEVMKAHLAGPAQLAAGASYKADRQPKPAAKQSFEEAVGSSALSPEQQAYLRRM